MREAYKTSIENTILDRQPVNGSVKITMGNLEFGEFDRVLVVKKAELQLLAEVCCIQSNVLQARVSVHT